MLFKAHHAKWLAKIIRGEDPGDMNGYSGPLPRLYGSFFYTFFFFFAFLYRPLCMGIAETCRHRWLGRLCGLTQAPFSEAPAPVCAEPCIGGICAYALDGRKRQVAQLWPDHSGVRDVHLQTES
jgi:hypothetical protein